MALLNFKAKFGPAVRSGEKHQTIRARGKRNPPKVGERLYLYSGLRTMNVSKLGEAICKRVTPISISASSRTVQRHNDDGTMWVVMLPDEIEQLARSDGFANAEEFFAWFKENHGATLSGYLIEW